MKESLNFDCKIRVLTSAAKDISWLDQIRIKDLYKSKRQIFLSENDIQYKKFERKYAGNSSHLIFEYYQE